MKTVFSAAALVLGLATAASADPVLGVWQTQVDDGAYAHVTIAPCGDLICGTISRTFNDSGEYNSANKGKPIVWDMAAQGNGSYKNGKIWQPSTGKEFNSKMKLNGDRLAVSGCVGPICKKQTWARVN